MRLTDHKWLGDIPFALIAVGDLQIRSLPVVLDRVFRCPARVDIFPVVGIFTIGEVVVRLKRIGAHGVADRLVAVIQRHTQAVATFIVLSLVDCEGIEG